MCIVPRHRPNWKAPFKKFATAKHCKSGFFMKQQRTKHTHWLNLCYSFVRRQLRRIVMLRRLFMLKKSSNQIDKREQATWCLCVWARASAQRSARGKLHFETKIAADISHNFEYILSSILQTYNNIHWRAAKTRGTNTGVWSERERGLAREKRAQRTNARKTTLLTFFLQSAIFRTLYSMALFGAFTK